ncbi:MAG: hypothetical protein ACK46G_06650 [Flavobacteriales bacterium]|jgi:hypothetical protein
MARAAHPWHSTHRNSTRRLALGLMVAFSLTLVAFEWRTDPPQVILPDPWDDGLEEPLDHVVVIRVPKPAPSPAPKPRSRPASAFGAVNPVEPTGPTTEPIDPVDPGPGAPGTDPEDPGPEVLRSPDEATVAEVFLWGTVGVRPYFMDCLKRSPNALDECTEDRIQQHLERQFKVPSGVRSEVRTTVTFEIDREGRIGKLVCAPRVNAEVEREIERVLRALPAFVPGSQGGIPVPVYYQIPLRVRSI